MTYMTAHLSRIYEVSIAYTTRGTQPGSLYVELRNCWSSEPE